MSLSIIIVNFNTHDLLKNCLASIFNQKGVEYEVWVVDNASQDGSTQMVEKDFPQVKLIKNKKNLGFAKGNNVAIRKAQSKYLFLLNSDTILKDQALIKIYDFLESNPKAGILGVKILNPDGSSQPSVGKFYGLANTLLMLFGGERFGFLRRSLAKTTEVDWVSGAAMIVRREVVDKIGLLDERMFMYMEEVEFCFRAKKCGFKTYFFPQPEVIHFIRGSGSKPEAILGIYKGLIYFYQKHMPLWQLPILRLLLKVKAFLALTFGVLTNNSYLRVTYTKVFRLI